MPFDFHFLQSHISGLLKGQVSGRPARKLFELLDDVAVLVMSDHNLEKNNTTVWNKHAGQGNKTENRKEWLEWVSGKAVYSELFKINLLGFLTLRALGFGGSPSILLER